MAEEIAIQFEVLADGSVRLIHPHSGMMATMFLISNEQFDAINKQRLQQKLTVQKNLATIGKALEHK